MNSLLRTGLLAACIAPNVWAAGPIASTDMHDVSISKVSGQHTITPSNAEAEANFNAARGSYSNYYVAPLLPPDMQNEAASVVSGPAGSLQGQYFGLISTTNLPANTNLEFVNVVVDVEAATLEQIMQSIVKQAAAYTGPWTVKWRLKPENTELMAEKVNLTAEAPFGRFIDLLTERVRNMSGVNLFVTSFPQARVILVADTYY
jgi:hypothetical protein